MTDLLASLLKFCSISSKTSHEYYLDQLGSYLSASSLFPIHSLCDLDPGCMIVEELLSLMLDHLSKDEVDYGHRERWNLLIFHIPWLG